MQYMFTLDTSNKYYCRKKIAGKIPREFLIINAIDDKANTTNTNHMGTNYFL